MRRLEGAEETNRRALVESAAFAPFCGGAGRPAIASAGLDAESAQNSRIADTIYTPSAGFSARSDPIYTPDAPTFRPDAPTFLTAAPAFLTVASSCLTNAPTFLRNDTIYTPNAPIFTPADSPYTPDDSIYIRNASPYIQSASIYMPSVQLCDKSASPNRLSDPRCTPANPPWKCANLAVERKWRMDAGASRLHLQRRHADWVDFVFVPVPTPFVIYADPDEFATFYANTKSNLNRVVHKLSAAGFKCMPDYSRRLI